VSFIECSFRERGVLFHAFSQLLRLEIKKSFCLLTLMAPEEINMHQNRQFTRMILPSRTPITARIVGIRGLATHQGIAFAGQMLDISGGGLSFITSYRLFCPLFLELSFVLPNDPEKFTVYGEIVRVSNFSNDSYRIAITFSNTTKAVLNQIDDYCKQIT
jgi:c-di-GMP-binding flagellar brake protein YcgR